MSFHDGMVYGPLQSPQLAPESGKEEKNIFKTGFTDIKYQQAFVNQNTDAQYKMPKASTFILLKIKQTL
jgi:hypothetical protein